MEDTEHWLFKVFKDSDRYSIPYRLRLSCSAGISFADFFPNYQGEIFNNTYLEPFRNINIAKLTGKPWILST